MSAVGSDGSAPQIHSANDGRAGRSVRLPSVNGDDPYSFAVITLLTAHTRHVVPLTPH